MAKINPFLAGLACRCPNCGTGALFAGFLKLRERCESCGMDLSKADSGDGPVVFILLIVGAIGCFGILMHEVIYNPPVWVLLVLWLPLTALLSVLAMRPFKGVMVALQFHNKAGEGTGLEG
jgi:uncharacterized protein (DUF983 family)